MIIHKEESCVKRTAYQVNQETDESIRNVLEGIDRKKFNKKFNELFENKNGR